MADKYLERDASSGRMRERVSADSSAGAVDAGKIVSLDSGGKLDASLLPSGAGVSQEVIQAAENLDANDLVEVFDDSGTPKVQKASAASATQRPAVGYVLASVALNDNATVFFEGRVPGQVGLTPGARIYLSTSTLGAVQVSPPTGAGNLSQFVGKAVSTTEFNFEADDVIELA